VTSYRGYFVSARTQQSRAVPLARSAALAGFAAILFAMLVLAPGAAAAEVNATGTWQGAYHCASGPCAGQEKVGTFVLHEAAGSSAVTGTLNVAGGGEGSVTGTLSGSTLTLEGKGEKGYTAQGVETISPDGLSFSGSYSDSAGTSGTLTASRPSLPVFEATPGVLRPSAIQVLCNYEVAPANFTCTAQVGDASSATPAKAPTGTVSFTAPSGVFAASTCTLVATPGSPNVASCAVTWTPAAKIPPGTPAPVTGAYSGDSVFAPSAAKSGTGAVVSPIVGAASSTGEGAKAEVKCPVEKPGGCPIAVELSLFESGGAITARKAKRKKLTIGSTKLTLKAGQTRVVSVALNRTGKKLLARHKHFTALLTISSGGVTIKTQKVQIKPKSHK
jgi:hypothetical protein